jgi:PST family polysaccharide transporter
VVPALLLATPFGVAGVAWAQAAVALALAVVMQAVASRVLAIPARAMISAVLPGVTAALAVTAAAVTAQLVLPGGDAVRLAGASLAGVAAGLLVLHAADRNLAAGVRSFMAGRTAEHRVAA